MFLQTWGSPSSWGNQIRLDEIEVYTRMLRRARNRLAVVADQGRIKKSSNIMDQLMPSFSAWTLVAHLIGVLPPVNFTDKTELDRSFNFENG